MCFYVVDIVDRLRVIYPLMLNFIVLRTITDYMVSYIIFASDVLSLEVTVNMNLLFISAETHTNACFFEKMETRLV